MREGASIFEFGPFGVDVLRRSLKREGQPVALSGHFEILVVLLEQRGEVVGKDALMRQVWPDTAVEENNTTVAISSLRKALGETPVSPKWIVTIPGRGYSFVGEVRSELPAAAETAPQIPSTAQPARTQRGPRSAYLMAGALLFALAGYVLVFGVVSRSLRSVAVLPFGVLNPDGKNDYLGPGLTDAVDQTARKRGIYPRPAPRQCQSIRGPRSDSKRARARSRGRG